MPRRPSAPFSRALPLILTILGAFILLVFAVDRFVLTPGPPETRADETAVLAHLQRHDVRRVTIPARRIIVELKDGKRVAAVLSPDREVWPAVRDSGADVSIGYDAAAETTPTSGWAVALQFVPFFLMAAVLLFILRTARRRTL